MSKTSVALLWALALAPAAALAQSAFDGTWKIDLGKLQLPAKPDVLLLQEGRYECRTCAPAIGVTADGADHAVGGYPYFDTMAVKVVDEHTVQVTQKKAGKVVATSTTMVSPDGRRADFEFSDRSNSDSAPVTGKGSMAREGKAPAGAHALSGTWRTTGYQAVSDNALVFSLHMDGDSLSMSSPTGQAYTARLDGIRAPYRGDPGITAVALKKLGRQAVEETDFRDGRVVGVTRMTVAPDGRSMTLSIDDKLRGKTMSAVAIKQ
ncbi:hypothetical protein [Frateuria defendens]|uniref:hypothetical protein n=1 Tax=Frateuria defendens TaxID=2219559 RepID=UPI00066FF58F|nr:hypothetical protein [Frateuria defendens]